MLINIGTFLSLPPEFFWLVEINKGDNNPIFWTEKKKKSDWKAPTSSYLEN